MSPILALPILLVSLWYGAMSEASAGKPPMQEAELTVSDISLDSEFKTASAIQLTISGVFPSGCYSWARADIKNVGENKIEVRAIAQVANKMCTMALIPFQRQAELGPLKPGSYELIFINANKTQLTRKFKVTP